MTPKWHENWDEYVVKMTPQWHKNDTNIALYENDP